jgi:hypothetical protein
MNGSLTRKVYEQLILLYPEPFRNEFGDEMLELFEECRRVQGSSALLTDVLFSAVKQQFCYLSTPAPERAPLYFEAAPPASLTRKVLIGVFAVALAMFSFLAKPTAKTEAWRTIRTPHRAWYPRCSNDHGRPSEQSTVVNIAAVHLPSRH